MISPSPAAAEATAPLPLPELLSGGRAAEQRLFSPTALHNFFAALRQLETRRARRPLRILQIGDSHTANDAFSSRIREVLQARFGAAGRGWLPIGIPFKYYRPRLVAVEEAGWHHLAEAARAAPVGIDAELAESQPGEARMSLASTEPEGFDRLALEILAQPEGGAVTARIDRHPPLRIPTAAPQTRARRVEIPAPPGSRRVELTAADSRQVRLLGWTSERRRPGIIYENHGTIGATVALFGHMDAATVAHELADSRPALIVVAFGTNEGFDDGLDPAAYADLFRRHVEALKRMAPRASILVLGPPDGGRLDTCTAGADSCATGTTAAPAACAWRPPAHLAAVRSAQKRIAAERGWAFWDWSEAMGGACSIDRLFRRDPPWAFADHVHLTRLGYEATADVLLFDLMRAYQEWQAAHPPQNPRAPATRRHRR